MGIWSWIGENLSVVADVATALALGSFAWLQWRISREDERRHRDADQMTKDRETLAEDQRRKAHEEREKARDAAEELERTRQRDAQITSWGAEVINAMSKLEVHCFPLARSDVHRSSAFDELDAEISALVDVGRLFFPNVPAGQDPDGIRVEILDQVLRGCYVARHMAKYEEQDGRQMRHRVWQARRRFVTLLQSEIKQSLRPVTERNAGESIPLDPRVWASPTVKLKLP